MPVPFRAGSNGNKRRILCYGDSLTVGFSANGTQFEPYGRAMSESLAAAGVSCEILVCGLSGRKAREMAASQGGSLVDIVGLHGKGLARILDEDGAFDLVIIMAGTNDMGVPGCHPQIFEDLKQLHSTCHARGVPTAALMPPPAPGHGQARENERRSLLSLLQKIRSMPGVLGCIDPAELVPPSNSALWEKDGLHFSPAGSRVLGERLASLAIEWSRTDTSSGADKLAARSGGRSHTPTALRKRPISSCSTGLRALSPAGLRAHPRRVIAT